MSHSTSVLLIESLIRNLDKSKSAGLACVVALLISLLSPEVNGQVVSSTGSYLSTRAITSTTVKLTGSDEVDFIRKLLTENRTNEALEVALNYTGSLAADHDPVKAYYAYNALCSALTSVGQLDEAIENCTTAITFQADKWSALNNRGTAKLVAGRYDEALEDFRLALSLTPVGALGAIDAIQHNMGLVAERSSQ